MALFQLDPQSVFTRLRASRAPMHVPTLPASVLRGMLGFALVSVAGFAPWPLLDRWFPAVGEIGLYVVCTTVFIGASGLLLHRLIIGPGARVRFYKLFALAFVAYAIVWVALWMWLRGDLGGIAGLLGGTAVMGAILAAAFDAPRALLKTIAALFLFNTLGYYAGGWIEGWLGIEHRLAGMLLWGACYGLGLGAGLGLAFYFCQERIRAVLHSS